ncbi:MAG: hypothetical protein Q8L84_07020 [Hyphomonas sp.]|nr:hypothetical protein [Hyphomonas sp.]
MIVKQGSDWPNAPIAAPPQHDLRSGWLKRESCRPGGREVRDLAEVINATISQLAPLIYQLTVWQSLEWAKASGDRDEPVNKTTFAQIEGWLSVASDTAAEFEIAGAEARIVSFRSAAARGLMTWRRLSTESRVLRETFEAGLQGRLIYRYPAEQARVFERWASDWAPCLASFPSVRADVFAAVDCWALGHGTASVFQCMRVLEHGLAALAEDVGEGMDVDTWHVILDRIEARIRMERSAPRGLEKTERLQFLSEAASAFRYFKDAWRNHVAHGRAVYDEHQARSVLEHTRGFMNLLSSRLTEGPHP